MNLHPYMMLALGTLWDRVHGWQENLWIDPDY